MKLDPYDWQLKDLEKLRKNDFTGLIAIEAGGGKSLLGALAVKESGATRTLIVAPKSTHFTAWVPTIRDNVGVVPRVMGNGSKSEKEAYTEFSLGLPGVYIVSPQWVTRTDVSDWRGDLLILDEIHQGAVTPKSKLQRKVSGYSPRDPEPLNARFHMRLALSATPARSDLSNFWGVAKFLWGNDAVLSQRGQIADSMFYLWQNTYLESETVYTARRDRMGNPVKVEHFIRERTPGQILSKMPCVIRHYRRHRCCDAHPEGFLSVDHPQVIKRTVSLTPKQKASIREMDSMMMTYLNDNPLIASIPLTAKQRVRQLTLGEASVVEEDDRSVLVYDPECKSPVIDEVTHILENLPEDEAVVVHVESQKFAEVITHRLNQSGYRAREYSGVRKADLEEFGSTYRVLVGVVSALGTGTSGLNRLSSTEIFAEIPISLTMKTQVEARLERMDNSRQVQRYYILDDMGVQEGRLDDLWEKARLMRTSMV